MGHFKKVCRECDTVVAQCRCPATNKKIEYVDASECPRCNINKTLGAGAQRPVDLREVPLEELAVKCSGSDHVWKGTLEGDGRYLRPCEPKADASCLCGDYVYGDVKTGKVNGSVFASVDIDLPQPEKSKFSDDPAPAKRHRHYDERRMKAMATRFIEKMLAVVTGDRDAYEDIVTDAFVEVFLHGYDDGDAGARELIRQWREAEDALNAAFRRSLRAPLFSKDGQDAFSELARHEKIAKSKRNALRALVE